MNVLVRLHTDNMLDEAYPWAVDFLKIKEKHNYKLTIESKWGIDLYHYIIYFDTLFTYNRDILRSTNFFKFHSSKDDTYSMIKDIYNYQDSMIFSERVLGWLQ